MTQTVILGVDIGGSAVKSALVDTDSGSFLSERFRLETPEYVTPLEMADLLAITCAEFNYSGPLGVGFPARLCNGIVTNAANIHPDWVGIHLADFLTERLQVPVWTINDADCAGLAEFKYNPDFAAITGLAAFLTLGTGIGSALFFDGQLIPGTELGHLYYKDIEIEDFAAASVRENQDLSWKEWAGRLDEVLLYLDFLLSPELYILGGGISKSSDKFLKYLSLAEKIKPAVLMNKAGIIGAALYCRQHLDQAIV